jgi:hypothetical protein
MKNASKVASGQPKRKWFVVVYLVGGTHRFAWHRTEPVATFEAANTLRREIERQGYRTLAPQDYALSMAVGLPETHCMEAGCSCDKVAR